MRSITYSRRAELRQGVGRILRSTNHHGVIVKNLGPADLAGSSAIRRIGDGSFSLSSPWTETPRPHTAETWDRET